MRKKIGALLREEVGEESCIGEAKIVLHTEDHVIKNPDAENLGGRRQPFGALMILV